MSDDAAPTITERFEEVFKHLSDAQNALHPREGFGNLDAARKGIANAELEVGTIRTMLHGCWLDHETGIEDIDFEIRAARIRAEKVNPWLWATEPTQIGRIIPATCKTRIVVGSTPTGLIPGRPRAEVEVETTGMNDEEVAAVNESARDVAEDLIAAMWTPKAVVGPEPGA